MNRPVLVVLVICLMAVIAGVSFADEPSGAPDKASTPDAVLSPGVSSSDPAIGVGKDYRLTDEDILRMDVWGEEQLSSLQMQITPDGKVNIPYAGEMTAEGLTLTELTDQIAGEFVKAGILINPRVQITLISMHQPTVRVLGEVNKPGVVVFKEGDTILDAISQAGSYTENAWLEKTSLMRKGEGGPTTIDLRKMLDGDISQNTELKKGDIIAIPPEDYENKVYVMGQVLRPSMYDLKDNTTVLAAINLAGGPTERASLRNTRVLRGDPKNPQAVSCNLTKLLDGGDRAQDILLQPGDVVMVPETKQPNWNKISQILSTILNFTYIRKFGIF